MGRIELLPPDVVTKIAAGEVIERPASAVKELVENSIDAGATRIDIDLEQGGTELIRVVDNGHGIHAADLPLAFAAHATSKLRSADDLFRILTKGFRGEALASIGGVAKVTLQSRRAEEPAGAEIKCDGGIVGDVRPWGGSPGTRIEVRHLFYSVPARKKFLKSAATEIGRTTDIVEWLALSHPGLHIVLRHNGKLVYDIPASASFTDRVALFFGGNVRDGLYHVDSGPADDNGLRLQGWIGDPAIDRGNAKLQYLFVNGRWFRDRSLSYAIQEGYRNLIMTGRHPVAFLFLTVPPDQVDVNAHPTKAEVRFRENSLLFSLIRATIKNRLLKENLVPRLTVAEQPLTAPLPSPTLFSPRRELAERTLAPWEAIPARKIEVPPPDLPFSYSPPPSRTPSIPFVAPPPRAAEPPPPPPVAPQPSAPPVEFPIPATGTALQLHDAYLVMETPDGMLVIDQHALHERILFEQLQRRIRDGKLEVQRLLIPEPIDLPANHVAVVLEAKDALADLGLEVGEFGGNTIILSSYPTLLSRRPPHEILQGVIDYLVTKEQLPPKEVMLDHLLATMACKAAVKAGDPLTPEEISHLLELRAMAEDSHHCPHGRPTSLLFSRQDLDRQFRRI
ncbi:DNA mismatch repair endonuclease MutL [Limnoglobus roseus]|uniref:DNA mismatch repair protein MutL n=1 Tax=Limnoglobus roseus TaxID=2598579 RepID=A0A5C1ARZ4_9BACT|nr:DNA mismatch repair endonuclease MutL [Limnoglobus roseus]QEL20004.1 DNA mismatch repair endonuclease MutL [Limnoglobus roseus]